MPPFPQHSRTRTPATTIFLISTALNTLGATQSLNTTTAATIVTSAGRKQSPNSMMAATPVTFTGGSTHFAGSWAIIVLAVCGVSFFALA